VNRSVAPNEIIVVSGLPRSGTSMMMQLLEAGGVEILSDGIRGADEDNPRGYYEYEPVKDIGHDRSWLPLAVGKAVKMISALLQDLPAEYTYLVILMHRHMTEILTSQRRMLLRRGEPADPESETKIAEASRTHLADIEAWLVQRPNVRALDVDYNEMLRAPRVHVPRIVRFLDRELNEARMLAAIDPSLYRQRFP